MQQEVNNESGGVIEVRFHGRGGQGVVIGAEILASAAMKEGRSVQAFSSFGAERRGAPVMAFTRIAEKPIRVRCQIYEPDYVVVLDPQVCQVQDVTTGLKSDGMLIINTPLIPEKVKQALGVTKSQIYTIDATPLALNVFGSPILNTIMLGAFAAATGEVKLPMLVDAVKDRFSEKIAQKNIQGMEEAYKRVKG